MFKCINIFWGSEKKSNSLDIFYCPKQKNFGNKRVISSVSFDNSVVNKSKFLVLLQCVRKSISDNISWLTTWLFKISFVNIKSANMSLLDSELLC
jgi:hypothetical protein